MSFASTPKNCLGKCFFGAYLQEFWKKRKKRYRTNYFWLSFLSEKRNFNHSCKRKWFLENQILIENFCWFAQQEESDTAEWWLFLCLLFCAISQTCRFRPVRSFWSSHLNHFNLCYGFFQEFLTWKYEFVKLAVKVRTARPTWLSALRRNVTVKGTSPKLWQVQRTGSVSGEDVRN